MKRDLLLGFGIAAVLAISGAVAADLAADGAYPAVRSEDGSTLFSPTEAAAGRDVARTAGASEWAHDWRRREEAAYREVKSEALYGAAYATLEAPERRAVDELSERDLAGAAIDARTGAVVVSRERAVAIREVQRHYAFLFGDAPGYEPLRRQLSVPVNLLPEAQDRKALAAFLFWSARRKEP